MNHTKTIVTDYTKSTLLRDDRAGYDPTPWRSPLVRKSNINIVKGEPYWGAARPP